MSTVPELLNWRDTPGLDANDDKRDLVGEAPSAEDARRTLASQEKDDVRGVILTKKQDYIYTGTTFLSMLIAGWVDGSTGPLIPALQARYKIEYLIMSVVFIAAAAGGGIASFLNVWMTDKLGFGKVVAAGALLQVLAFSLMCWLPPYPLFVIAFFINGVGTSLQDAQCNSIVNFFTDPNVKMGIMHAVYGAGATLAPLVATVFVQHVDKFYLLYAVSLGLSIVNLGVLVWVFKLKNTEQLLGPAVRDPPPVVGESERADAARLEEEIVHAPEGSGAKFGRIVRTPTVVFLGFFIFVYVGLEITIGGWIVSYLIDVKSDTGVVGDEGFVASGFWGGLTVGRIILMPLNAYLGDVWSIYVYLGLCLGLEFIVWFVKGVVGPAVSVSLVGMFLGPQYPIVMRLCGKLLGPDIVAGAVGFIASFGAVGGCIFPFLTGALAQKYGVQSMQPVIVSMIGACLVCWFAVPKTPAK